MKKISYELGENICKPHNTTISEYIKNSQNPIVKKQKIQLENRQKIQTDISAKKIHTWQKSTWELSTIKEMQMKTIW